MDPRTNELEWNYYQRVNVADQRSYGEIFNSFAELELETGVCRALPHNARPPGVAHGPARPRQQGLGGEGRRRWARA